MLANLRSICLILFLSLAGRHAVIAQMSATGAFVPPSANNLFMGNAGRSSETVDVDLYTGGAVVNVPLCTLPGKQLNIPITLNYTGGRGIRLQQYATQAGLGWQLNAGGSVSRTVRGFPDENSNGYVGGGWGNVLNSAAGNTSALNSTQQSELGITSSGPPTVDGEPDQFSVTTPFFSFQFTFDGNGNAIFSNSAGYKVQWPNHSSFIVTDDQGNQYFFGSSSSSIEQTYTTIYGTGMTFTTTWYLDKIVAYNSSETINLTYFTYGYTDYNYHYYTQYAFDNNGTPHSATTNIPITYAIISPKYISTISSNQAEISFNYQADRQDDHSAARLTGFSLNGYNPITQNYINSLTSYTLNYSYFGAPSTDTNVLRLCLNNITASAGGGSPLTLYSFTYDLANTLPSRQSQNFDFWGYYTILTPSTANPLVTPSARQPNLATTETDVLTTVTDVQGESYEIGYELNTWYSGGNVTIGGLRVNQIIKTWNGTQYTTQYTYNNSSGNSTGQTYNTINTSGTIVNSPYNNLTYYQANSLNLVGETYSESPYLTYDLFGNFVGYSAVKVTNPNQSYTVFQFTNFNTTNCQDETFASGGEITSAASKSYKRGLLTEKTLYTASGNKISDDKYNYSTLNTSVTATSWAYHWLLMSLSLSWCDQYIAGICVGTYSETITDPSLSGYYTSFVENYRLTSNTHTDYDQLTPANSLATTTTYTYDVDANDANNTNRLVSAITTTDSKNQTDTKTYYYPIDVYKTGSAAIPLLTSGETSALNAMVVANFTSPIVHSIENRNGTQMAVHNSYATATNNDVFLATSSIYKSDPANPTATLADQQNFNYDLATGNAISTNSIGGKNTSVLFGYNSTLPVAKIENASSTSTPSAGTSSYSYTVPNGTTTSVTTYPFTVLANGTINVMLVWPSLPASGSSNTAQVTYTITGPAGFTTLSNETICISSNFNCSGYTHTVTDPFSCIAGNYVLTISNCQNPENNFTLFQINYPGTLTNSLTNEFFYEGFETTGNYSNNAHTGTQAWSGSYTVPFNLPNSRSYLLQYWNYNGSAWVFNQQAYTGPVTLSGTIDDVRVFPTDALLSTYTYSPGVGETSETDPGGHSTIYQYDGFRRLTTVRDQDNNILKQYDYEFQSCAHTVPNDPATQSYFRNNCSGSTPYGSEVTYNVAAGKYTACTAAAADQLAANDIAYNGQNYANANGSCSATAPCVAPINVAASANAATVTVTWTYPPGVGTNAYAVYVRNSAGTTVYDNYGVGSPLTISSGLAYSTTYTVSVLSLCGSDPGSSPVTVTTGSAAGQAVNLTNQNPSPSGFCCHGCQYTSTVYSNTPTIGPGSLLYTDAALTQPLTGMTFIFPYNNNTSNYIYQLSGNTVTSTTVTCH
ncbi:MAG TPA: DUF5977 domain-containing protein [Puia sp.]|nr:DUF5977 domain-containing protein [Puia sp.]